MGETTAISWCDHTFNPWIGCMKVSPACDGCYAENLMATRYKRVEWGAPGQGAGTRVRTSAGNWSKPRAWNGEWVSVSEVEGPGPHFHFDDGRTVRRVGAPRAGRLLDGVLHDDRPRIAA